ncbi:MAG: FtsX-like permease family protein, partial [Vicinamibacterales bacterium]
RVVRTSGAPAALGATLQEALRTATGLPVASLTTMRDEADESTSRQRFNVWLMSLFGASALLLAAIGIYGLMAYSVEQRTRELGVRLALGADLGTVRRMVLGQGMRLAAFGIVVGLAAAGALSRLMTAFLFEVTATDPLVFVVAPLVLAVVALLAVWLPARRASRVDPIEALRLE